MIRLRGVFSLFLIVVCLSLLLVACSPGEAKPFVPLPPPMDSKLVLNIQQLKVGETAQLMSITSPHIKVTYRESGVSAGKTATEVVEVSGVKGTMLETTWGDWENATLQLNEYYGTSEQLVRGMITLQFDEASILQIFTGRGEYTVNRSYLVLLYEPTSTSSWPILTDVSYTEVWGVKNHFLFGGTAVWNQNLEDLLSDYTQWGFWEVRASPADVVANALSAVVARKLEGVTPSYELIDLDSPRRELIGRQTGFHFYRNGNEVGFVDLEYKNDWGRMPNTLLIGTGALSKIEWYFGGKYYALLAISPAFSPVGSTLYLFVDDSATAETLLKSEPISLYPQLREGQISHVFLATHTMGDIGSISSKVVGGEGGTVKVGDEGGVQFRTLGNPQYKDVALASNLLAMLGKNGLQGVGLYYAYQPGSGSGLCYYLAALRLILADPATVLNSPWRDIGILDTVGIPDLESLPF